ncbi:MAG: xylose isomerase, partial [Planctomycetes bacterium]|nr:xylose isomerase [Planctomycetota bacterium]
MAGIEKRGRKLRVSYCTNVHPGESVAEVSAALSACAAPLARALRGELDLGVGLWLARAAARELAREESALLALRDLLCAHGLTVFTLNAFPFGGFHAARVKERVFVPSWAERARLEYTADCGRILAALLPAGEQGSVSTVPLGHRAAGCGAGERAAAVLNLRAAAAAFARIEEDSGRRIVLCLEPEPCAALGTVGAAARFLAREVFAGSDDPARRHLGVCLDACHEAVLFQEPARALADLKDAGVA